MLHAAGWEHTTAGQSKPFSSFLLSKFALQVHQHVGVQVFVMAACVLQGIAADAETVAPLPLGLTMIVKNEGDFIKQTLDSLKDEIDYWTVVDTGGRPCERMDVALQIFLRCAPSQGQDRQKLRTCVTAKPFADPVHVKSFATSCGLQGRRLLFCKLCQV